MSIGTLVTRDQIESAIRYVIGDLRTAIDGGDRLDPNGRLSGLASELAALFAQLEQIDKDKS